MKITNLNSVASAFKAYNKTAKKPEAVGKTGVAADKVEISSKARDIQVAMKALSEIPESRSEKVEAIKTQISQGTYKPSADELVDKLFSGLGRVK
ncbi:flagellar biosynthesis anti-sigma factor FlgM [Fusibacter tunisiensis]|jgi:negative regulator of flagellin synthesis FlgM|uniref:Negative regulator of flagellin synthesis n=1 Tax=Fusibacter tunisiensis TaxID=1008308 RepID=A0ABS2MPK9_9FIRM|nr:flagellar biosynthesis anti-sigma factor FlgM [Fusibacter tunisiensis]MBM7561318.1 negative regulator of flagellin synthesis FlgM [Fusibacter tunisiensis]